MNNAPHTIANILLPPNVWQLLDERGQADAQQVVRDLCETGVIERTDGQSGPHQLSLLATGPRLFIMTESPEPAERLTSIISLNPLKPILRDYALMVQSHQQAVGHGVLYRAEALDMGRRGLHNEGAEMLRVMLQDEFILPFETARQFFTLVCVLFSREADNLNSWRQ